MNRIRSISVYGCALLGAAVSLAPSAQEAHEAFTGLARREMAVTAHPLATDAAVLALKLGGSAADAAVAAQAVLGLVEPQASGLGGGGFAVYYDARARRVSTLDGRETAPAAADENRFLTPQGAPLPFGLAWQSGLAVGVPGVPKLLEALHRRHGRLPWPLLFAPATLLARQGFELTEATHREAAWLLSLNPSCAEGERLFFRDPAAFRYFADEATCTAKPAGTVVRNPEYADTLARLAFQGAAGFYAGPLAANVVAAVRGDRFIPGDMTLEDLSAYRVIEREPVCADYRGRAVCGMGPPSSGGLAVGQMLGLLARSDLGTDPLGVEAVHRFTQAGRLAFADRDRYVADPGFVAVPARGMLDPHYLAARAASIGERDMGTAAPGVPPGAFEPAAPDPSARAGGTSHLSIVDRHGDALALTTSVESSFGNGVMVPGGGFLLNNQLTDFAFVPRGDDGAPVANRAEPRKRPRSSMAPTLVFDAQGRLEAVTGSPGGARIIGYVAQSLVNLFDFGLDPQRAVEIPHFMNLNAATELEIPTPDVTREYDPAALSQALVARGHRVELAVQPSGLGVIRAVPGGLLGGADPRREGTVGGR